MDNIVDNDFVRLCEGPFPEVIIPLAYVEQLRYMLGYGNETTEHCPILQAIPR